MGQIEVAYERVWLKLKTFLFNVHYRRFKSLKNSYELIESNNQIEGSTAGALTVTAGKGCGSASPIDTESSSSFISFSVSTSFS
jgi:hypothetical protein